MFYHILISLYLKLSCPVGDVCIYVYTHTRGIRGLSVLCISATSPTINIPHQNGIYVTISELQ